jgi:type III pantothenate kinase
MLLAIDVDNTNTKLGLYRLDGQHPYLAAHWRLTTHRSQTVDEYGSLFVNLFAMNRIATSQVTHIIVSSVVPPVESTLLQVCQTYFHVEPLFVEPGINTGMSVLVDHPAELGADRLADSIGA